MSQASKKVDWCIAKAKRELSEGKSHRGLVEGKSNEEKARDHLRKAEHNLSAILYFDKGGFSDWSMSAAFYSMYHCFLAIAVKFGYESRNQECTAALIRHLNEIGKIKLDEKFIKALESYDVSEAQENTIIEKREEYTYGTSMEVKNREDLKKSIELCKDCLLATKSIING